MRASAITSLIEIADGKTGDSTARLTALECLATWEEPSIIDPIVGLWRPVLAPGQKRAVGEFKSSLAEMLARVVAGTNETLTLAAASVAGQLRLSQADPTWVRILASPQRPARERVAALNTLAATGSPSLTDSLKVALGDADPSVRAAAIPLLASAKGAGIAATLAELVNEGNDLRLVQAAWSALGKLSEPEAVAALLLGLERFKSGNLPVSQTLDLFEACGQHSSENVRQAAAVLKTKLAEPESWAPLLSGGDSAAGRLILTARGDVECLRCHKWNGAGGIVGPPLDGIGQRQSRSYLIESIIYPNRAVAPGFENATLELKDGRSLVGVIKHESTAELEIDTGEDGVVKIKVSDVTRRTRGISAMPEGLGRLLSPFDLRNLVEYLANPKGSEAPAAAH